MNLLTWGKNAAAAPQPSVSSTTATSTRCEFDDVTVSYGDVVVLENFSARVNGPGLCTVIGHNGAGKTTLLKLACGLQLPISGEVRVDGLSTRDDWASIRRRVSASLYSERAYHFRLTGLQNLIYFGRLAGFTKGQTLQRVLTLREEFSVDLLLERKFSDLSLGQRKIFGMIVAFVLAEDLVVLDEPTATLDAANSRAALSMMQWAVEHGTTVLISTHDSELVDTADQVVVL